MLKTQTLCYHSKLNMSSIGKILKKYSNLRPLNKGGLGDLNYLDMELIISNITKKPRAFLLAHPEYKIVKSLKLKVESLIWRRIKGGPLAYILGEKEFYGLKFKVNKNVLIPRPETEMIVDHITQEHITKKEKTLIIDVGTGSGCIIITLAKLLNNPPIPPYPPPRRGRQGGYYKFLAADISLKALQVARQNAKFHKVDKKIKFIRGNLLAPFLQDIKNKKLEIITAKAGSRNNKINIKSGRNYNLVILANLPYLTPAQIKKSPSIQYEPKIALNAGRDGLKYYRQFFKQIKTFAKFLSAVALAKEDALNSRLFVICEIDPSQALKIKKIIKAQFPKSKITIKKDLRGLNRMVIIKI